MLDNKFIEEFLNLKINKKQYDFFDIIPPKEVIISKWVEFILNPKENGVGIFPVQSLMNMAGYNYDLNYYEFDDSSTEVITDNQKRMDIVLKFKGLWIIIENKIESLENAEQTNEYFSFIEKNKGNNEAVYIYLKPNYNKSEPINKKFVVITYDEFISELKKISIDDYSDKNKYKYLHEFIISGGRFMKNNEIELTESIKFYVKELDRFKAIEDEYNNKNKLLFEKIANETTDYMNEIFGGYKNYKIGNWIQFYKDSWNNEKHNGVHFEIIFSDSKILGRNINASVVLHIENNISEQRLNSFKFIDITKKGNQALLKNEEIKELIQLDFTSVENIEKSINKIYQSLFNLAQRYEHLVDAAMK